MSRATDLSILMVTDQNFVPGARATLQSINDTTPHPLTVHLVAGEKVDADSADLLAAVGVPLVWHRPSGAQLRLLESFRSEARFGYWSTYARVLLGDLLPETERRVIYLDSDTIVRTDLQSLWTVDLEGKTLGAVSDQWIAGAHVRSILGFDTDDDQFIPPYFNAGVFVADLERWRNHGVGQILSDFLSRRPRLRCHDQDALNLVLRDDWHALPPAWNALLTRPGVSPPASSRFARGDDYSREAIIASASIVHFLGSVKPWHDAYRDLELTGRHRSMVERYFGPSPAGPGGTR